MFNADFTSKVEPIAPCLAVHHVLLSNTSRRRFLPQTHRLCLLCKRINPNGTHHCMCKTAIITAFTITEEDKNWQPKRGHRAPAPTSNPTREKDTNQAAFLLAGRRTKCWPRAVTRQDTGKTVLSYHLHTRIGQCIRLARLAKAEWSRPKSQQHWHAIHRDL